MGIKNLKVCAVILVFGSGLAAAAMAGGSFEKLHQTIVLTATTNAPAEATGAAEFHTAWDNGTNSADLRVETKGLDAGTYTVSVTDSTGTNTYDLGTFVAGGPTNPIAGGCWTNWFDVAMCTNTVNLGALTNWFHACRGTNDDDDAALTNWFDARVRTNQLDCTALTNWVAACVATNSIDLGTLTNWFNVCFHVNGTNDASGSNSFPVCTWTNQTCRGTLSNWFTGNVWLHGHGHSREDMNSGGGSGTSLALPSGVSPLDIAVISVADSNAVVDLVGDTSNLTNTLACTFNANVAVSGGNAGSTVTGHAWITLSAGKGKQHGEFLLEAQGAPPHQELTLVVNGAASGIIRTDAHGKVTIKSLPGADLSTVTSVAAEDAYGNVVFSVTF
jgi:hypothetical protein